MAREAAARGATVLLVDADHARANAVLTEEGIGGHAYGVDLSSVEAVVAWRDQVHGELGRLDGFIHLVGGWAGSRAFSADAVEHHRRLTVPVLETLQVASAVLWDDVRASSRGSIAMVSSVSVAEPTGGNAAYAALKAAAETWTRALASELDGSAASASVVRVRALVDDGMRASRPEASFEGWTDTRDLARALCDVAEAPAPEVNGAVIDLTAGAGYSRA